MIAVLFFRLGQIMFFDAKDLEELAESQWTREISVTAKRGSILDCTGEVLAQSGTAKSVLIRPKEIKKEFKRTVSDQLAEILDMDADLIYEKACDEKKSEIWIKRQITEEQEIEIISAGLVDKGVSLFIDTKRYYPYSGSLSQVLGYTNIDGEGQAGIEKAFNKYMTGYNGTSLALVDALQNTISGSEKLYIEPQNGFDVVLTVDQVIQSFAENAAKEAYEINDASAVVAIVMDPENSDIKAMVNYPEMDLNDIPRNDINMLNELARNRAVTDAYEPGSTFKIITTASAIDSGVATLESTYTCNGYKLVDGEQIKCWRSGNPHGTQTLTQAVEHSCNPAFMQMALDMQKESFYSYIYDFGFGAKTNISGASDAAGIVRDQKYVKNVDLARIGFGQSIAVTPLQLANSICATVNGGILNTPRLVKEIRDEDGNPIEVFETKEVRQVISADTSQKMRSVLESVVANGSGSNAQIEGYKVGGKTGTAQMYDENGKIASGKVISSFVCFAPADDPEYLVLFIVYEPKVAVTFGSVVAAPFAKDIMENCLKYTNVPKDFTDTEEAYVAVPNIVGMSTEQAKKKLAENDLYLDMHSSGEIVLQSPAAGIQVKKGNTVAVVTVNDSSVTPEDGVPNVVGMSISEAYHKLTKSGLKLEIEVENRGCNIVTWQYPEAGSKYGKGDVVIVRVEETAKDNLEGE